MACNPQLVKYNHQKERPSDHCFFVLDKHDINTYQLWVVFYGETKTHLNLQLPAKTNRYVFIDKEKIPVIFKSDYVFSVFDKGDGVRTRRYVIHEGYSIKFTPQGEITE